MKHDPLQTAANAAQSVQNASFVCASCRVVNRFRWTQEHSSHEMTALDCTAHVQLRQFPGSDSAHGTPWKMIEEVRTSARSPIQHPVGCCSTQLKVVVASLELWFAPFPSKLQSWYEAHAALANSLCGILWLNISLAQISLSRQHAGLPDII